MTPSDVRMLRDPVAMRRAVDAVPLLSEGRACLHALELERLWVKPGRHCHAAYRITIDEAGTQRQSRASATLLRDPDHGPALLRAARTVPAARAPWSVEAATVLVESPCAIVQLFPWDHRLPTLPGAVDPEAVSVGLGFTVRSATPIGYWPGMRCQIRYDTATGPLFGKVFPDASGEDVGHRLAALAKALDGASDLAVPRVHAWLRGLQILVTTPLAGDSLLARLERGAEPDIGERVGAALARLHTTSLPEVARPFGPDDDLGVVEGWVRFAGAVFPDLAAQLQRALDRVARRKPNTSHSTVLVHRDFYDKQVLVDDAAIGLLDLDTLCRGDAEIDVANFTAHLALRGLQWHQAPDALDTIAGRFLAAYRERRADLDDTRIAWYRATATLRLACVYAMRPWWAVLAPRLIAECERALG